MVEKYLPYLSGLGLIIAAVLTWMSAGRKSGVDESGIVFAQWEKLMNSHKEDMRILKSEFVSYREASEKKSKDRNEEIDGLRKRLSDVEDNFAAFRRESDERIRQLDDENRGLRREIAQIGHSAHAECVKIATQTEATDAHLREIEPEARQAAADFQEQLHHLDNLEHNSKRRSRRSNTTDD